MNHKSVVGRTADEIIKLLYSGEFLCGDKLPSETVLAKRLNVGRPSVREALRMLVASGHVEIIPNRGAFATAVSPEDLQSSAAWLHINQEMISELLVVRGCIEPLATEFCARRISDKKLSEMAHLLEQAETAHKEKEWRTFSQLDFEFHRMILEESKNRFFIKMYGSIQESFMQYCCRSMAATYHESNALSEHLAIFEAIKHRSTVEARTAMELHLLIAQRRVLAREIQKQDSSPKTRKDSPSEA